MVISMFYKDNDSAKLLNMEDVIVQKVENVGNELHVYIMLPRKTHKCPCCGSETNRVHDYRDLCEKLDAFTTGINGAAIQTNDLVINPNVKLI